MEWEIDVCMDIGKRESQQDFYLIYENIIILSRCFNIYVVADGHGKHDNVNNFIKDNILIYLKSLQSFSKSDITKMILKLDNDIFEKFNDLDSGTCVFIALLDKMNKSSILINVGDVLGVIIDKDNFVKMTSLHNFENIKEVNRTNIKSVRHKGLNISRTIGDFDRKKDSDIIISKPSIYYIGKIKELFILSDGVDLNLLRILKFKIRNISLKNLFKEKLTKDNYVCIRIILSS